MAQRKTRLCPMGIILLGKGVAGGLDWGVFGIQDSRSALADTMDGDAGKSYSGEE